MDGYQYILHGGDDDLGMVYMGVMTLGMIQDGDGGELCCSEMVPSLWE